MLQNIILSTSFGNRQYYNSSLTHLLSELDLEGDRGFLDEEWDPCILLCIMSLLQLPLKFLQVFLYVPADVRQPKLGYKIVFHYKKNSC